MSGKKAYASKTMLLCIAAIAAILLHANVALAIVADPEPLAPADRQAFQDFSTLIGSAEFAAMDELYVGRFGIETDKFMVAQIRNERCVADKCLTFIASYLGGKGKIVLAAYLPSKMTLGDTFAEVCPGCGRVYSLMFEDSLGSIYSFGVSDSYAVMGPGSLRALAIKPN